MALISLKSQLKNLAMPVISPELKTFVPEGELAKIFNTATLERIFGVPAFQIPHHKVASTAKLVIKEAQKILAICLELSLEHDLVKFIECDISDSALRLDTSRLSSIIPESAVNLKSYNGSMSPTGFARDRSIEHCQKVVSYLMSIKRILEEAAIRRYIRSQYIVHIRI